MRGSGCLRLAPACRCRCCCDGCCCGGCMLAIWLMLGPCCPLCRCVRCALALHLRVAPPAGPRRSAVTSAGTPATHARQFSPGSAKIRAILPCTWDSHVRVTAVHLQRCGLQLKPSDDDEACVLDRTALPSPAGSTPGCGVPAAALHPPETQPGQRIGPAPASEHRMLMIHICWPRTRRPLLQSVHCCQRSTKPPDAQYLQLIHCTSGVRQELCEQHRWGIPSCGAVL